MKEEQIAEVGPWAEKKLGALEKYLEAYTTVLQNQPSFRGYVYVDGFAGGGRSKVRRPSSSAPPGQISFLTELGSRDSAEQQKFIDGSPRVALNLAYPFTHYVFLETNPTRLEMLRRLKDEFSGREGIERISVWEEDCNSYLNGRFLHKPNWKEWRSLVFLDPFGMQVPWATFKELASTRAIEVFVNFPEGMAVQRMLRRDYTALTPEGKKKLDAYFGSSDWFDVIYEKKTGMFGPSVQKIRQPGRRLALWYRNRLERLFGHASPPMLVRNSKKGHLYYLIHAGPNETGSRIAHDVFRKHGDCLPIEISA